MKKIFHSIFKRFQVKNDQPMFCSQGLSDGAYDLALQLIEEYRKEHPNERITDTLVRQLVKDYKEN